MLISDVSCNDVSRMHNFKTRNIELETKIAKLCAVAAEETNRKHVKCKWVNKAEISQRSIGK